MEAHFSSLWFYTRYGIRFLESALSCRLYIDAEKINLSLIAFCFPNYSNRFVEPLCVVVDASTPDLMFDFQKMHFLADYRCGKKHSLIAGFLVVYMYLVLCGVKLFTSLFIFNDRTL